jgi:hypothetical protein
MDRFLGVRFDPDIGNLRNRSAPASVLRDEIAVKFRRGFADLRIIAEAGDETSLYRAIAELQQRTEQFIQLGDVKPGGSLAQYVPNIACQDETLAKLQAIDFRKLTEAFIDSVKEEFGERGIKSFEPFVKTLSDFELTVQKAHHVGLRDCLSSSAGRFLAPFARIDESPTGARFRTVLYFYPKNLQYSESWLEDFAHQIEDNSSSAQVRVTAGRFVGFELKRSVIRDMEWIFAIVAVIVSALVLFPLRSLKLALLAMVPLVFSFLFVLGGVALAERMGWDLALNYINLMIFPILLGSAVDYGIYIVFDYRSGRFTHMSSILNETGHSLVLCCMTTVAGYGSMIIGTNTGLTAFGWTAILGYSGALFAALVILPVLLGKIEVRKNEI